MEDEGNFHVLAICDNRIEIATFCRDCIRASENYWALSDFIWAGSHFSPWNGPLPNELKEWMPINLREFLADRN
jgi:hypothetical protein